MRLSIQFAPLATLTLLAGLPSCGASSEQQQSTLSRDGGSTTGGIPVTTSTTGAVAVGVGGTGSVDLSVTSNGTSGPTTMGACATESADAMLVKEPVDIILVLDNSGSMADELAAVEQNINVNFANILAASDVDYRVILISRHRKEDRSVSEEASTSICVTSPLSGLDACYPLSCDDQDVEDCYDGPVLSDRFFQYSTKVESTDSFDIILDTYAAPMDDEDQFDLALNGWSEWLRPEAKKVFLEMTDDNAEMPVDTFLSQLTTLSSEHFGSLEALNFVWHSIIGIQEKATPTDAHLPSEPIQAALCTSNANTVENAGESYQDLSIRTGGLRFPLCQFNAYDVVFRTIAEDVVVQSNIACDFAIPEAPIGNLDLDNVAVNHTPMQGAEPVKFGQVLTPADCQTGAFYIDTDRIVLCPQACDAVRAQPFSTVDVLFTCESQIIIK